MSANEQSCRDSLSSAKDMIDDAENEYTRVINYLEDRVQDLEDTITKLEQRLEDAINDKS